MLDFTYRGEMMTHNTELVPLGHGHKAEYLLITSCKGGVGKSTSAVGLATALARRGKRVLLCDCDFDMRCLDLILGLENEVVYDLYDAAVGRVPVEKTIMHTDGLDDLGFIAAPFHGGDTLTSEMLGNVFRQAEVAGRYDYVILDTPGSLVSERILGTGLPFRAVIVASHQPSSIRAADKTGEYLSAHRVNVQRLLINCFDMDGALSGKRPGINEIIDRSFIQLCGIVPNDRALMLSGESGKLLDRGNAAAAFDNIACRLMGRYVPLFTGFSGRGMKRRIKRLLG